MQRSIRKWGKHTSATLRSFPLWSRLGGNQTLIHTEKLSDPQRLFVEHCWRSYQQVPWKKLPMFSSYSSPSTTSTLTGCWARAWIVCRPPLSSHSSSPVDSLFSCKLWPRSPPLCSRPASWMPPTLHHLRRESRIRKINKLSELMSVSENRPYSMTDGTSGKSEILIRTLCC